MTDILEAWIYAVHRPDGSIAYVGQTTELPALRFRAHLRDATRGSNTRFHQWLRKQVESGECPRVSVLEKCPVGAKNEREIFWIQHHHAEQAGGTLNTQGVSRWNHIPPNPLSPTTTAAVAANVFRGAPSDTAGRQVDTIMRAIHSMGDGPIIVNDVGKRIQSIFGRVVDASSILAVALHGGWRRINQGGPDFAANIVRTDSVTSWLLDRGVPLIDRLKYIVQQNEEKGIRFVKDDVLLKRTFAVPFEIATVMQAMGWRRAEGNTWVPADE